MEIFDDEPGTSNWWRRQLDPGTRERHLCRAGALLVFIYAFSSILQLALWDWKQRSRPNLHRRSFSEEQLAALDSALAKRGEVGFVRAGEPSGSPRASSSPFVWAQFELAPRVLVGKLDSAHVIIRFDDEREARRLSEAHRLTLVKDLGEGAWLLEQRFE